ncbi:S9 family peptidase [Roseateles sp. BYS180W]|uniref:S9 family peptidase n=1 Tax=Roseateles rivi TaxID=3299028 RepID=A0ABW7FR55_9BURK
MSNFQTLSQPRRGWLPLLALAGALALPVGLQAANPSSPAVPSAQQALTLERLYRAQPYRGEAAKSVAFSRSGRYMAFLWNPAGEPGQDLYVRDLQSGKQLRLSSPALMAAFDTPEAMARFERKLQQRNNEWAQRQAREEAQAAYLRGEAADLSQWEHAELEALRSELEAKRQRDEARKAADKAALADTAASAPADAKAEAKAEAKKKELELWELRDELKKKQRREKLKPEDLYPGVAQFVWGQRADELIFQYRGQLLRWRAGDSAAQGLVQLGRRLTVVSYMPRDEGFWFQDETRLMAMRFDRPGIVHLNPELQHPEDEDRKYRIEATTVSEDGRWMSLLARAPLSAGEGKPAPKPGRQVEIMGYEERFATARKVDREVSDDKRMLQPLALYIRPVPSQGQGAAAQPQPVFTHPGGDTWFEVSPLAWTRQGSHYAFATWEREISRLRVYLGRADEKAKPELVLERRGPIHHELVSALRPQFTPDGHHLVVVLDQDGWRQPFAMDLNSRSVKPLLQGQFEAHQVLGFSPDSRQMFVLANKDDLGAMNLWRVDMASGAMTALGQALDYHRNAAVSRDGQWAAAVAGHWGSRPELKLLKAQTNTPQVQTLTQSHDPAWAEVDALRPERIAFTNRHGDTLHAYVFKPQNWRASDRRPAVVYVYGGPLHDRHTVETDSFQPSGYLFNMYMAARHGYVTVSVDTRGHSNYGRRFADANWEQPGQPQTEDLEDLLAYMSKNLGVDPARVGLNGWSFGGFQTQFTMFTKPELFAAGIAGAGPTEWENYNSWYSGRTIGKVDRSKPVLRKYSLLPLARGLRKPLMLVHGMQDDNVLYQDTVNVYRALLESGKEGLVELFLDPEGGHAMGGAVKTLNWHRKYEAFWLQHLGPAEPAAAR